MTGDSRPRVVILTGGALPGDDTSAPADLDYVLASGRSGAAPDALAAPQVAAFAREMYRAGYERAAKGHRVVAVWVVDGEERAAGFAAWVTREIDPAYVVAARDPLAEMLNAETPEDPS